MISRPLYHPESGSLFLGDPAAFHGGEEVHPIDPTTLPAGTRIQTTLYHSEVLPSMDFETYSEAGFTIDPHTGKVKGMGPQGKGGLPVVGTPVYAEHPSTEVLSLCYDLKDGRGRRRWFPGFPVPQDLYDHIAAGG